MYKYLLIFLLIANVSCFAFDFKVSLNKKTFEDESFDFLIQKVVDARLNKQKPIGTVMVSFSLSNTVGNDSLGYEMNNFFNGKPEMFDAKTKIIIVINQLNIRYIREKADTTGKKAELEFSIAIDYYLEGGKTCGLLYQQFFKFKKSTSNTKITKDINKGFSETIKSALIDFKKQLKINKKEKGIRRQCNTDSLFQFLANKPEQVVTNQNIKDGLYFSCKDLYLNNPGAISNYSFTDSTGLGQRPLIVKVPDYILERVYAIVKDKRIYIYIGGGNYKEALLEEDGKLFFADITSAIISNDTKASSVPIGVLSSLASTIKQAGTAITTPPDVILDYETGDLVFR